MVVAAPAFVHNPNPVTSSSVAASADRA